jgi:hypothetical protein
MASRNKKENKMKLKNLSFVAMTLSSVYLFSCTASGNVTVTTSPTPTPAVSSTPGPTPMATSTPMSSASPTANPSDNPGLEKTFKGTFTGNVEVPPVATSGVGNTTLVINTSTKTGKLTVTFVGLSSDQTGAHIHGPAAMGESGPVLIPLPLGQLYDYPITLSDEQFGFLEAGKLYVNVHSTQYPNGEIRAQLTAQ